MIDTPVLIVGAGPTGLTLALSLARRGTPFRIVDEKDGPGHQSRAMVVHARTLEFYRQFGFAGDVINGGIQISTARLREGGQQGGGKEILHVGFADFGKHLSPYPFVLAYPQDDHERLLVDKLTQAGIQVEWNTRVTAFQPHENGATVTVSRSGGPAETIQADYVCGCDGRHSVVREQLQVPFSGGSYPQLYFVADVKISRGFEPDLVVSLGEHSFALLLPVGSRHVQRLIGLVPVDLGERHDLKWEDIRDQVEPLMDVHVTEVNWFSTYKVHHRVAEHFRIGSAFLLGDAGHVHSPAGGQGMNTGIGDAINLGWKLAHVVNRRAGVSLLDTYELERIAFARTLVESTDQAFRVIIAPGLRGQLGRQILIPLLALIGTHFEYGQHAFFNLVSQVRIEYEDSPISEGKAGRIRGGDRLPWIDDGTDNFAPLGSLDWQMHVYGQPGHALKNACDELRLPCHIFTWSEAAKKAGFRENAAYLVRPDGYVALALEGSDGGGNELETYIRAHGIKVAA